MSYIDGFVVAVPTANKDAYREMAERAATRANSVAAISARAGGRGIRVTGGHYAPAWVAVASARLRQRLGKQLEVLFPR